jgi:hypothetical protein
MLNLHCEGNSRFQADDRLIVLSVSVGKDSVGSLKRKISTSHAENQQEVWLTGGTSLGIATSFLNVVFPFSIGHLRSTFSV